MVSLSANRTPCRSRIASPFGRPNEDIGAWLTFEVEDGTRPAPSIEHASEFGDPRDGRGGSAVRAHTNADLPTMLLLPGATLPLLGPGGVFGTSGDNYTPQAEGSFRRRATYHRRDEGYAIASNWVTVTVDP